MEAVIRKCSFENWYHILRQDTVRSVIIPLPDDFKEYMLNGEFIIEDSQFPELEQQVSQAIDELGGKAFGKLNFTAPTDSAWIGTNRSLEITSFNDFVYLFKASTRILIDIKKPFGLESLDIKPYIVLKRWFTYKENREFRIFMKNKDLFFVCSRYVDIPCEIDDEIIEEKAATLVSIVVDKIHPTEMIIDMYISPKLRPHFIDIAPWNRASSALLYDWDELNTLESIEIRRGGECGIQPSPDPAVPQEMLGGASLEDILKSLKDFEAQCAEVDATQIPDEFKTVSDDSD